MFRFLQLIPFLLLSFFVGTNLENHASDASLVATSTPTITVNLNHIRKIGCISTTNDRTSSGTMIYIKPDTFLTANHVVSNFQCFDIETQTPLTTYLIYPDKDIAILTAKAGTKSGIPYNCDGFSPGRTYFAFGYAGGTTFVMNRVVAGKIARKVTMQGTDLYGLREIYGLIIPGMSGGPIVDEFGVLYGINNITMSKGTKGYSREIKDTALCNGNK